MTLSHTIATLEGLATLYGVPNPNSIAKETDHLTAEYRRWLEAAPFYAIATSGDGGLDCSPRGDGPGQLLHILDACTLAIPDRRGNNRLDTLKNIIADPRVGLLFLVPGINETLRINGRATITTDPALVEQFDVGGKKPASVIHIRIEAVYFQCARALARSRLWEAGAKPGRADVPTAGQMTLGALPGFDAEAYDAALPARQKSTLY